LLNFTKVHWWWREQCYSTFASCDSE
jgi:hypothetical protein